MCDNDIPALVNHLSNVYCRLTHSSKLVRDSFMCLIFDQGITANGNNG